MREREGDIRFLSAALHRDTNLDLIASRLSPNRESGPKWTTTCTAVHDLCMFGVMYQVPFIWHTSMW